MNKKITEGARAEILRLSERNPGWDEKDIARVLKGTEHELEPWAVAVVLVTKHYRDK